MLADCDVKVANRTMDPFVKSEERPFRTDVLRIAEVVSGPPFCVIAVPWNEVDSIPEMRRME